MRIKLTKEAKERISLPYNRILFNTHSKRIEFYIDDVMIGYFEMPLFQMGDAIQITVDGKLNGDVVDV